jgi:hypothetical protein
MLELPQKNGAGLDALSPTASRCVLFDSVCVQLLLQLLKTSKVSESPRLHAHSLPSPFDALRGRTGL